MVSVRYFEYHSIVDSVLLVARDLFSCIMSYSLSYEHKWYMRQILNQVGPSTRRESIGTYAANSSGLDTVYLMNINWIQGDRNTLKRHLYVTILPSEYCLAFRFDELG